VVNMAIIRSTAWESETLFSQPLWGEASEGSGRSPRSNSSVFALATKTEKSRDFYLKIWITLSIGKWENLDMLDVLDMLAVVKTSQLSVTPVPW
jgi:hypothetical protein